MALVKKKGDIQDAVKEFDTVFSTPITHACQYYALYYLVEVKGRDELEFELRQKTTTLRDAFYNYSVFSTAKEASHIRDHFYWENRDMATVFSKDMEPAFDFDGRSEEDLRKEREERRRMAIDFKEAARQKTGVPSSSMIISMAKNNKRFPTAREFHVTPTESSKRMEKWFDIYTRSDRWLNTMEDLFGTDWLPDDKLDRHDDEYGWSFNYGGDGWARVAETALLKDEIGRQAYVDLMWSVEHNNGNFVDKVELNTEQEVENIRMAIQRMDTGRKKEVDTIEDRLSEAYLLDNLLPGVLDAAREERLRFIFNVARRTINSVSMRRYGGDIPDTRTIEEPIATLLR